MAVTVAVGLDDLGSIDSPFACNREIRLIHPLKDYHPNLFRRLDGNLKNEVILHLCLTGESSRL